MITDKETTGSEESTGTPTQGEPAAMKLPNGCFGRSKDMGEPTQPRRVLKEAPPATTPDYGCTDKSGSHPQRCGCHRRGAIRRSSREQSSRPSSSSARATREAEYRHTSDKRTASSTVDPRQKWNDQQRELDNEQNRRFPARKPVPVDKRETPSTERDLASPNQGTSVDLGGRTKQSPDFIGLSIARAVSPLTLGELTNADPTFPPSPMTPEEKKGRFPWS
jgi:hypothetical protein